MPGQNHLPDKVASRPRDWILLHGYRLSDTRMPRLILSSLTHTQRFLCRVGCMATPGRGPKTDEPAPPRELHKENLQQG
ncbi:hypothetical protein PoMZ_04453 [Pyricularia oryzae]|uniref:Uncharacterized protein n=1 Tax=Pyricularia oryzae TaxID=318829 RepID=A0A4P7NC12_PYROR|nr:hypothetical protein PoMZ_04453 [Pyricularia oryzae]